MMDIPLATPETLFHNSKARKELQKYKMVYLLFFLMISKIWGEAVFIHKVHSYCENGYFT